MVYHISRKSLTSQFVQILLRLNCNQNEKIQLQLASWRPGRYEVANYAEKIRGFKVVFNNIEILWKKSTKDLWEFEAVNAGEYEVHYEFYANQMDAGGSWSDDRQLYLNFTNLAFEVLSRKNEPVGISFSLPKLYEFATALPFNGHAFKAENYQHLMDSPFLASENLKHFSYQIGKAEFHLWFQGEIYFEVDTLLEDLRKVTEKQIEGFGEFPAENYHFIFQLLPYTHFHGVEHQFSTVITFGPADSLDDKKNYDRLVAVSSHELYHFWNVCRIRPKEIKSYDLSREILLDTGLVLEGVTTYMGDLYLLKSGYYSLEDYLLVLEKLINREFGSFGWENQSLVESSRDLWLDGYKVGIPDKKVSIYNRGALISLCLDLMLLDQESSLQQVMTDMWIKFAKKGVGYSMSDFQLLIKLKFSEEEKINNFFSSIVYGREDIVSFLQELLQGIGLVIQTIYSSNILKHNFGIITDEKGKVIRIHPRSEAYYKVMLGDRILAVGDDRVPTEENLNSQTLELSIIRWCQKLSISVNGENVLFFPEYKVSIDSESLKRNRWMI